MNLVSQKEQFEIVYDGPSLKTNEMDVRDLAPALLAISDVLEESNKIVYGDKTKVQVNVKGSFRNGSFGVDFSILQGPIEGFTSLFSSDRANAAANLLEIVGFFGKSGLIGFLTWLGGRQIKKAIEKDKATTIVEVKNEKKEVSPTIISLFSNVRVRTSLQKIITEPLSRDGVESFSVKKNNRTETTIRKDEKDYFKLGGVPDEPLKDQARTVFLKALSVTFVEGNKWRFSDGSNEFYASVLDEKFINDVQKNKISFTKDDTFEVRLREKQWMADTGLKTEHEIEKVIQHRSTSKQIKLPFSGKGETEKGKE
jgi:hypothetical protein